MNTTAETAKEILGGMEYYAKRHDDLDFWIGLIVLLSGLVLLYGLAAAFVFCETTRALEQIGHMFVFAQ